MEYPGLTPHERVALAAMAKHALDHDHDPQSFIGWHAIAAALGRGPADLAALNAGIMLADKDEQAVMRVLRQLRLKGAITVAERAVNGMRARYSLAALVKYMPRARTEIAQHAAF